MLKIVTLLFGMLLTHMAIAQNQPLACQTEATAGMEWENGRWQTKTFVEQKFVLVQSGNTLTSASVAKAFHSYERLISCRISPTSNYIICTGTSGEFLFFNSKNLRGGLSYVLGATMEDTKRDSVIAAAFSCTPF